MRISIRKINEKGVDLSLKLLKNAVAKYERLYARKCDELYQKGYMSASTYCNESEIWDSFFDTYPELVQDFVGARTGSMILTCGRIKYICRKYKEGTQAISDLKDIYDMLSAKQALRDFSRLSETVRLPVKSDLIKCRANLAVSGGVSNTGRIPLDSPYVRECLSVEGGSLVSCGYGKILLDRLYNQLGVVLDGDFVSILGAGFTQEDDLDFYTELVSGELKGESKYGDLLYESIESYYVDYYGSRTTIADCPPYGKKLYTEGILDCIDYINEFRGKLPEGAEEIYVTSDEVIFFVPSGVGFEVSEVEDIFVPSDLYSIYDGRRLSCINRLMGYGGEYMSEQEARIAEVPVSGVPVKMYRSLAKGHVTMSNMYHLEFIKLPEKIQMEDSIGVVPLKKILETLGVDSLDTLDIEAMQLIDCKHKKLAGRMFQTLVCVRCDYTLPEHSIPNQMIIGDIASEITFDDYLDACIAAETLYNFFNLDAI